MHENIATIVCLGKGVLFDSHTLYGPYTTMGIGTLSYDSIRSGDSGGLCRLWIRAEKIVIIRRVVSSKARQ